MGYKNGFKQSVFGLTPGITIYTRNFLVGLSTKIGLNAKKKFSYQDGKFDPFGSATIATVSYDLPIGDNFLSLSGNYVLIDDEPNFTLWSKNTSLEFYLNYGWL